MAKKKEGGSSDLATPPLELGTPELGIVTDTEVVSEEVTATAIDPWALLKDALDMLARIEYKTNRGGVFHMVLHSPDGGTVPFSCVHNGREDLNSRMEAWSAMYKEVMARIDEAV